MSFSLLNAGENCNIKNPIGQFSEIKFHKRCLTKYNVCKYHVSHREDFNRVNPLHSTLLSASASYCKILSDFDQAYNYGSVEAAVAVLPTSFREHGGWAGPS